MKMIISKIEYVKQEDLDKDPLNPNKKLKDGRVKQAIHAGE